MACWKYKNYLFKEDFIMKKLPMKERLWELFMWCAKNNKPYFPEMYRKIDITTKDPNKNLLAVYNTRLNLVQYKGKNFMDSDFSNVTVR